MMQKQDAEYQPMKRAQYVATGVLVIVALLLVGLAGRVAWLERNVSADQVRQLSQQHNAVIPLMPTRGTIYFSDGTEAATSVRMYNMFVDPSFVMDTTGRTAQKQKWSDELEELSPTDARAAVLRDKLAHLADPTPEEVAKIDEARAVMSRKLAPLLKMDAAEIVFKIEDNAFYKIETEPGRFEDNLEEPRRFMWLQKEVDEKFHDDFIALRRQIRELAKSKEEAARTDADRQEIRDAKLLASTRILDGVGFVKSVRRIYPLGPLGGYLLGGSNIDGGTDAIEFQFEPLLKGRPGKMVVVKDAQRRTLDVLGEQYRAPDDGRAIWLTIDPMIQAIVEEELKATCEKFKAPSGCAVILDPKTGKVLAMANYPPFDPSVRNQPLAARRNNSITAPFEPGSIFKPFIMAHALDKGIITADQVIDAGSGTWFDPTGRRVTDTHGVGIVKTPEILQESSNIGMAKIGWIMGNDALYKAVTGFGFGYRTGVELPGDERGLVSPLAKWTNGTKTSVSFGYAVAVTPLQLVRAFGAFGNDGKMVTPHVVSAVETAPGQVEKWTNLAIDPPAQQVISAKTAATMRDIMEGVFSPKGTAKGKQSQLYRFYGKTGTAHLALQGEGHYSDHEYNSSFLIGGPVTNTRLVGVMTVHKPDKAIGHFAATVAAPGAVRMMERSLVYLHVQPDQPAGK